MVYSGMYVSVFSSESMTNIVIARNIYIYIRVCVRACVCVCVCVSRGS